MIESSDQSNIMINVNINFEFFHIFFQSKFFFAVVVVVVAAVVPIVEKNIDAFNIFVELRVIPLTSFENGQSFENLKKLIIVVNKHVDSQNYAVTLNRTKKSKLKIKKKLD